MDIHSSKSSDGLLFWTESLAEELLRFLTRRLKCRETAADLTHETYVRLQHSVQKTPPNNARALAYKIALNLAIDYQRKNTHRQRYTVDIDQSAWAEKASTHALQPEQTLISKQRAQALRDAMSELPVDCRTAFHLHSIEGLTYAQIAERLNISTSMVNRHLSRAMLHCRSRLQEN